LSQKVDSELEEQNLFRTGVLYTRLCENILINHSVGVHPEELAENGIIDCIIVETEDGFSQLGMMTRFLSRDLGLRQRNVAQHALDGFPSTLEKNIQSLADWNRFDNPSVTLVAIPSERQNSLLKGLILVPHDRSECYKKYAGWRYGIPKPHRDFFYNITYEAIAHAHKNWGCKRIGITHFYGDTKCRSCRPYHRDLTTCQVEAMVHFCNEHAGVKSFTFIDDYEGNQPLEIASEFNDMAETGMHRPISVHSMQHWGIDFLNLRWEKAASSKKLSQFLGMETD